MSKTLSDRAYDANVRVGTIFHIPTMIVDPEGVDDALREFIADDLDERVCAMLEPVCPGLTAFIAGSYDDEDSEYLDKRQAEKYREYHVTDFLRRNMKAPYIVCVQYMVVHYHSRGSRFPLGSLQLGWGFIQNDWVAAISPEHALREGIKLSLAHQRAEWAKAPKEKKRHKVKPEEFE